jgi:dipeptidyl-peptidase-4
LWQSERDGWRHLYHYERDGTLRRRVTSGGWEFRGILRVDESAGHVYFNARRDTVLENHVYRVGLGGGPITRLTEPGFSHRVRLAPTCRMMIDTYSSIDTPPRVALRDVTGTLIRVISENEVPALAAYRRSPPEFVRVPTSRGYSLNGALIRPPHRRWWKRYPVMVFTYAGPHGPIVHNRWEGRHDAFKQLLAQQGILVWTVDPHAASGEGAVSAWHSYKRLGVTELADLEDSLRWLARHAQADLSRVGIQGGSYGGFMTAFALTHSDMFSLGIAVSSVTDWRNYDSIYTEAFMLTPEHNPEGYAASSVTAAADRLHGRLLLVHGALDDNVHLQNAMQLMDALQRAGKSFDAIVYPRDDHGVWRYRNHWPRRRYEFIVNNL